MNHQEFLNKRLGKRYKEVGFSTYECVALSKLYATERGRGKIWILVRGSV